MKDLNTRAKEILSKILYITISTVTPEGKPWNSPVYSAYDENYTFYWTSWKENQHSKNIEKNNNVFLVIYDSTVPEGTGEGVYIQAKVYVVTDEKEIQYAREVTCKRVGKDPYKRKVSEFLGDYPRRIYKAIPEKVWMNSEGDINGNYIDTRVEVQL